MKRKLTLAIILGVFLVMNLTGAAKAAEEKWPSKPITIYIGYAPGGGMDMMGRLLSEEMRKTLGVAMPVVNMTGANSAVAMNHVYQQPKDGYSLFGISSALCTFPATGLSKLSYKDFGMVGILFGSLPTFTVPADSPIKSGKELIDGIKKGGLTASNSGIGGIWHVPQMIVVDTVKGNVKYVPYNGGAPAAMAAAKKEVDFGTHDLSEALTLIKSKMLRPLIVFSEEPFVMDDGTKIPPITDFVPEMKGKVAAGMGWRSLGYVKGTPQDRVDKLIAAFKAALKTDAVKNFAKKNLLPIHGATGVEADKIFELGTRTQSWILYDIKEAKNNPQDLGIPRP
ncbi:MAG: tripartite tricarboxylate transporter substrate binding protein [Proteobacteria bacterium]|nr:tripartite tricarboxylate transporter substrate binding protein [Pseudomonadota bacterium]